ncbi:unnamed protein product [Microthlaspi erraticum]|uniref:Uncharacterized protein n=1 Tax=Microthlaspi erraticum TaxID=1685480 RepID=A0A6D2JHK3_9BRAS|nr:unnamed protein product [Microthlaspi erraticum]
MSSDGVARALALTVSLSLYVDEQRRNGYGGGRSFIKEYVNRRRMEKKAAAVAGKNLRLGFSSINGPEKRKTTTRMAESRQENEFRVNGGGVYESFVFQCFSP